MNQLTSYDQLKVRVQLVRDCPTIPSIKIDSPTDVYYLLRDEVKLWDREKFLSIMLNSRNTLIAIEEISIGSLDTIVVHPREVFKSAILANAHRIILVHNHPSQNPKPSREDKQITDKIYSAAQILDIQLVDHLIITQDGYTSWAEGWLQNIKVDDDCPF